MVQLKLIEKGVAEGDKPTSADIKNMSRQTVAGTTDDLTTDLQLTTQRGSL
jgi:hypothetical protein